MRRGRLCAGGNEDRRDSERQAGPEASGGEEDRSGIGPDRQRGGGQIDRQDAGGTAREDGAQGSPPPFPYSFAPPTPRQAWALRSSAERAAFELRSLPRRRRALPRRLSRRLMRAARSSFVFLSAPPAEKKGFVSRGLVLTLSGRQPPACRALYRSTRTPPPRAQPYSPSVYPCS